MSFIVLNFVNLFFVGILAGTLFVIDYGVGPAIVAVLDEQSQIQMRQALIRSLRVLVPIIFILTILSGIAITVLDGFDPGFAFRLVGLLDALTSFSLTLIGTAPINATVLTWQPSAPPKNWRTLVSRWERLGDITPRLEGRGLPTLTSGLSCFAGECMDELLPPTSYLASAGIFLSASPAVGSQSSLHPSRGF